jgi:hypothetical protein
MIKIDVPLIIEIKAPFRLVRSSPVMDFLNLMKKYKWITELRNGTVASYQGLYKKNGNRWFIR